MYHSKPWEVDWGEEHEEGQGDLSPGLGSDLLLPLLLFLALNLLAFLLTRWSTNRRHAVPVQNPQSADIVAARQALHVHRERYWSNSSPLRES